MSRTAHSPELSSISVLRLSGRDECQYGLEKTHRDYIYFSITSVSLTHKSYQNLTIGSPRDSSASCESTIGQAHCYASHFPSMETEPPISQVGVLDQA